METMKGQTIRKSERASEIKDNNHEEEVAD